MIPMGDGVRLATDLYLPCHGDGSLLEDEVPALLVRTSYDKTAPEWDDVIPYLDEHLKGMARAEESSPVRIFVMGTGDGTRTRRGNLNHGGYWRNEAEWPLARARLQTLCLHEDGTLDESAPDDANSSLTYTVDPRNPVPTVGGPLVGMFEIIPPEEGGPTRDDVPRHLDQWTLARNNLREVIEGGGFHQKEGPQWIGAHEPYQLLGDRSDVLTFETAPVADDTEITGAVTVNLWVYLFQANELRTGNAGFEPTTAGSGGSGGQRSIQLN